MEYARALPSLIASILIGLTAPASAFAQAGEPIRTGFWFNAGLGAGNADCELCANTRVGGIVGVLAVGGTLSQKFVLGASATVWIRHETDITQTLGALNAVLGYYPFPRIPLHLQMGLGFSARAIKTATPTGSATNTDNGTAAIIGVAYDFRVARNVSLTPFASALGVDFSGQGTGLSQVGLGITVH